MTFCRRTILIVAILMLIVALPYMATQAGDGETPFDARITKRALIVY